MQKKEFFFKRIKLEVLTIDGLEIFAEDMLYVLFINITACHSVFCFSICVLCKYCVSKFPFFFDVLKIKYMNMMLVF